MINLQKEFLEFHDNIKLDDENETLREKRDILLKKLKDNISDDAESYTTFNQGSYAMGTGIKPEDEDYDIDVGLKFNLDKDSCTDPLTPKKWVRDALKGHTRSVDIRRSCVTVSYQNKGESVFHVDFGVYAANNSDGKMYIAKGKEFSSADNKVWELSDPQGLINSVKTKFTGDDSAQFRRVIRYLKKWRTHHYTAGGNGAPTGISLTILAYNLFSPSSTPDWSTQKRVYDDCTALYNLIKSIVGSFVLSWDNQEGKFYHIITTYLPVEPYNDLFEKMSKKQLESLYQEFEWILSKLDEVKGKDKRSDACSLLVDVFGEDFPITVDKSLVGTSESA